MPRKQPFSNKQKKSQLLIKRAAKRGDEELAAVVKKPVNRRPGRSDMNPSGGPRLALESKFVSIPKNYQERTRDLAYSSPLERPLPDESAAFPLHLVANPAAAPLTVPARPKFRYGQTKKEVEKNEEGVFRKWMAGVRGTVEAWVEDGAWSGKPVDDDGPKGLEWIHSPSWFETNLEVWRQLWRVVEASSILLLLIDSRCPPVHCPPSLRSYLRNLKPRRQIILVLTKADLVNPSALEGWKRWLREWWNEEPLEVTQPTRRRPLKDGDVRPVREATPAEDDDVQIISVSSYDTTLLHGPGRTRHRPEIPDSARSSLVGALKTAHQRCLQPPAWAASDPEKLAAWKPPVRSELHWDELEELDVEAGIKAIGKKAKADREAAKEKREAGAPEDHSEPGEDAHTRDPETEPLTIGLVGQPNVGKSSLLNALLGSTRVRASKTPGKTKHFQTILWGARREIKIVDCPGLVCPSLVPMELQAMAGILPISQIPSLPSCIHFAARHMPLEEVFRVPPPEVDENDVESRKTWRGDRPDSAAAVEKRPAQPVWTAGEIMEERALDRGFLLRTLADGRVRWGFWPPGTRPMRDGRGVWLGAMSEDILNAENVEGEMEMDSESESGSGSQSGDDDDEVTRLAQPRNVADESGDESSDDGFAVANNRSFFAALDLNDDDDDEEDEEGDDDEEA